MWVEQLGEGSPELAIVGAVHGDEPCGVRAIERILRDPPEVDRPVKLVVANEEALERGVRYVDADLNRAFSEDTDPDAHEYRLARDLADELEGCTTVAFHSTQSHPTPFAIVNGTDEPVASICPWLSIVAVVDIDAPDEGRLFAMASDLIEIEAGYQGSDEAAENAHRIALEFLAATGALDAQVTERDVPVYRLGESIEKRPAETYEVFVENFSRVEAGEAFAAIDGEPVVAERAFYPILLSAYGYDHQFGYVGDRAGVLEASGPPA